MTKTETQIAQENIEKIKRFEKAYEDWNNKSLSVKEVEEAEKLVDNLTDKSEDSDSIKMLSKSHKSSCQRFLEFLEDYEIRIPHKIEDECPKCNEKYSISPIINEDKIESKITDLKQAIKLYSENGI